MCLSSSQIFIILPSKMGRRTLFGTSGLMLMLRRAIKCCPTITSHPIKGRILGFLYEHITYYFLAIRQFLVFMKAKHKSRQKKLS